MTVTQQKILDKIAKDGFCVVMHGYRTNRKNGSYGSRDFNAAIALRDAGLVLFKSINHYIDCRSRYSDHWSEIVVVTNQNQGKPLIEVLGDN